MKIMKKVMAFFLCAVMTMAMSVSAFAAQTYTITVDNEKQDYGYTAYQVFTGSLDKINNKATLGNIEWSTEVNSTAILTALKASDALKTGDTNDFDGCGTAAQVAEVLAKYKNDSAKMIAFADIVGRNVVKDSGHGATYNEASNETSANYTISGLDAGYYIVVNDTVPAGQTSSRYIVEVVGNTSVTLKVADTPTIDKTITNTDAKNAAKDTEKKTNTAAIGDTINYQIAGTVPNHTGYNHYYYIVNDNLSTGLTLNKDSFKVTVNGVELTEDTDYYVYTGTQADGHTFFQLAFENIMDYKIGDAIVITYNATVNENAAIGTNANTNTATLTYSNNPNKSDRGDKENEPGKPGNTDNHPTGETPQQITKTYVTELQLAKVDGNGDPLKGAEFTLTGENLNKVKFTYGTAYELDAENGTYYKLATGAYTETAPDGTNDELYASTTDKYSQKTFVSTSGEEGQTVSVKAFVDANGKLTFTGLTEGEYTLTETVTPAGYNTADPITFKITATYNNDTADGKGGTVNWGVTDKDGETISSVTAANGVLSTTVVNNAGSVLPSTGGIGTTIFYVLGSVLVLGAAVVLIARKRMNGEKA